MGLPTLRTVEGSFTLRAPLVESSATASAPAKGAARGRMRRSAHVSVATRKVDNGEASRRAKARGPLITDLYLGVTSSRARPGPGHEGRVVGQEAPVVAGGVEAERRVAQARHAQGALGPSAGGERAEPHVRRGARHERPARRVHLPLVIDRVGQGAARLALHVDAAPVEEVAARDDLGGAQRGDEADGHQGSDLERAHGYAAPGNLTGMARERPPGGRTFG